MAKLVVTFTKGTPTGKLRQDQPNFPIFVGSAARSEIILVDASTTAGNLTATALETFVVLKSSVECFVNIGSPPVAVDGEGWHLSVDERLEFFVSEGEGVACLTGTPIEADAIGFSAEIDTAFLMDHTKGVDAGLSSEANSGFVVVPNQV